jgi:hypothetical protein
VERRRGVRYRLLSGDLTRPRVPCDRTIGVRRCGAARRGGNGDYPGHRDWMRGLGLAGCSPRRLGR